ncbi:response regulator transcription factor [Sphingopyxis bauzanensis]|uniref:response regulator transcription factor n=1 Tax=Sphingopyxis bauzanensis TaxID=651663 RepID=UPI0030155132
MPSYSPYAMETVGDRSGKCGAPRATIVNFHRFGFREHSHAAVGKSGESMVEIQDGADGSSERNVYVIDDDGDVRQSLHFLLGTSHIRAWPFAAAEDFFDLLPTLKPAPLLLDLRMPKMDGLQVLEELRCRDVSWPVIIMTAHGDIATAVRSVKMGAIEFLEKPFEIGLLDEALAAAFGMLGTLQETAATRSHARALLDSLSPREQDVVATLLDGSPNKLAAHQLGLSVRTVEMHRKNALTKLRLKSIAEVVALVAKAERTLGLSRRIKHYADNHAQ